MAATTHITLYIQLENVLYFKIIVDMNYIHRPLQNPTKAIPVNTKKLYNICRMLDQRRRRWTDVAQMLYKCFVFAGMLLAAYLIPLTTLQLFPVGIADRSYCQIQINLRYHMHTRCTSPMETISLQKEAVALNADLMLGLRRRH